MITYKTNPQTKQLEIVQAQPVTVNDWPKTITCVIPDPCPGCGGCRLCDSKCTC